MLLSKSAGFSRFAGPDSDVMACPDQIGRHAAAHAPRSGKPQPYQAGSADLMPEMD